MRQVMKSINQTLNRAAQACDFVYNTVRFRTANQSEALNKNQGEHHFLTRQTHQTRQETRSHLDIVSTFNRILHIPPLDVLSKVSYVADEVACTHRTGFCGEAVALAFNYLRTRGERGMAAVEILGYNHIFLVMGFETIPLNVSYGRMDFGPPPQWGKGIVVCDPWYHEWFIADIDWMRKVRQIVRRTSEIDMRDSADLSFLIQYYI